MAGGETSEEDHGSEQGVADEANSDITSSSGESDESDPGPDENVGARKPSKKALENAANEVSIVDSL